jgi:uncharacterized protein YndB with AHSA1/START domain
MTDDTTLVLRRTFSAPAARVYAAWTTPDLFAQWIGPVGVPCTLIEMDGREGGSFRLDMHVPGAPVVHVAGRFTMLRPPVHLAFTWGAADGSVTTRASVTLTEVPGGTEMEFRHHLPSPDMVGSHRAGWDSAFGKLQRHVEAAA